MSNDPAQANISRRFYLRDAVAILPDNRRDLSERLARSVQLAGTFDLNLEITLDTRFFMDGNPLLLEAIKKAARSFSHVIFHLHGDLQFPFGQNTRTRQLIAFCRRLLEYGCLRGLCVHPDLVEDFLVFESLAREDVFVGMEILDETATGYNTFESMADLLGRYDFLDLVLDTAHIEGMESQGEPPLEKYCKEFHDRIAEVHLSKRGNYYPAARMGASFDTNHSLFSLSGTRPPGKLRALETIDNLNLAIEGVIPAGEYGEDCLRDEIRHLAEIFS